MSKKTGRRSRRQLPRPVLSKSAARRKQASPHVPRFRVYIAVSLDGYIADNDGGVGWLGPYSSAEIDFAGFMKTIGVTVVGRVTFDWAVSQGQAGNFRGRTVLLTHRPLRDSPPGVEVFGGDVRVLASQLRRDLAGTGKDVWLIGGGQSIATFHAEGLVDSWEISVIPVLLGDGIPLFPKHPRGLEGLKLIHGRTLANGIAELRYEPARRGRNPRHLP